MSKLGVYCMVSMVLESHALLDLLSTPSLTHFLCLSHTSP